MMIVRMNENVKTTITTVRIAYGMATSGAAYL